MLPFFRRGHRSYSPESSAVKAHRAAEDDVWQENLLPKGKMAEVRPSSCPPAARAGNLPFRVEVLDIILNDHGLRERFLGVLRMHYSEEGVLFLEAVRERASLSPSKAKLKTAAKDIVKTFVVEGSQHQINLSSDLRAQLEGLLRLRKNGSKELAQEDVFRAAVTQVYKDVKQNQWFSDFVQTSFAGRAGGIL